MALDHKLYAKGGDYLRDSRDMYTRAGDALRGGQWVFITIAVALAFLWSPYIWVVFDLAAAYLIWFFLWRIRWKQELPFKKPKASRVLDANEAFPGSKKARPAEGILYLGNQKGGNELWFSNSDARTHILYLGTTGAGKTEGLKSLATNTMVWSSGFIYIDGKADTDLWSSISALARRFGRDDDLLVLNYMTGNADRKIGEAPSNSVNPFSSGSAAYLTQLLTSLMPEAGGDNAMWKDRAISLMSAVMPILTYRRDELEMPLGIINIREALEFKAVVKMSRDPAVPEKFRRGVIGYLNTLPGYNDDLFDDDGNDKPQSGNNRADTTTVTQQHGYLSMQFTRALQSLSEDYNYIFESPYADIDMNDVVLNRRIVVVLIPALEKSSDETANLGKIIVALLKGMMGATLGSTVEGSTDLAIENKPTRASTPFMAIFDEVGYYATAGMAVMAAQARSLGFSLVFAGQDLSAIQRRVKEEANSITANCNLKIFGKLEDPNTTKDFFEKTVGEATVIKMSNVNENSGFMGGVSASDKGSLSSKKKASYDDLRNFREGDAVITFGATVLVGRLFYADPSGLKSLRVQRFIPVSPPEEMAMMADKSVDNVLERFQAPGWSAGKARLPLETEDNLTILKDGFAAARKGGENLVQSSIYAVMSLAEQLELIGEGAPKVKTSSSTPSSIFDDIEDDDDEDTEDEKSSKKTKTAKADDKEEDVGWAEFLGKMKDAEEDIAKPEKDKKKSKDSGMSWDDLLDDDDDDKDSDDEKDEAAEKEREAAATANAMSWDDFLGGDDDSEETEADSGVAIQALDEDAGDYDFDKSLTALGNAEILLPPNLTKKARKVLNEKLSKLVAANNDTESDNSENVA